MDDPSFLGDLFRRTQPSLTLLLMQLMIGFMESIDMCAWQKVVGSDGESTECRYACLLFLLAAIFFQCTAFASDPGNTVQLKPDQNVSALVNSAPAGTTFVFSPGTYRMQSIVPKNNDAFIGNGAIMNGGKLLEMQPDGGRWSAVVPVAQSDPAHCAKDHPRCGILNDLFIDDQVQAPADSLSEIGPGRWFYDDSSGKAYISTDPAGHKVEFSMTTAAFSGTATGVQISHLVVEKYATPPQNGAIGGNLHAVVTAERSTGSAQNWKVLNTEVRWSHGGGIVLGASGHVESCNVHDNGQLGVAGHGTNVVILNNEIANNNYAGFDPDWEAGATKFSGTDNLVVRSNYVHDNNGNGLWTDIDNIHTLYEKNKVINNKGEGLRHEISYDAIIRNNLLKGNKAGIVVVLSPNVEVYGNVIEVPANGIDGIRIANGQRGVGAYGPHIAHDDHVHNNIITYLGPAGRSGLSGPLATATGVTFDSNEYHIIGGGDNHWIWSSGAETISAMHQAGLEQHATISKAPSSMPDPTH
jgi:hypothetical protein